MMQDGEMEFILPDQIRKKNKKRYNWGIPKMLVYKNYPVFCEQYTDKYTDGKESNWILAHHTQPYTNAKNIQPFILIGLSEMNNTICNHGPEKNFRCIRLKEKEQAQVNAKNEWKK